ncbi:MAG: ribonuclease [Thermoleophilia bacterium]|nr:ribonuclease [Thermoleophilia bacterium]
MSTGSTAGGDLDPRELVRDVAQGLVRDHSFHYAAGVAFRTTLALFPLLLATLSILSLLGAGDRAGDVLGTLADTDAVPTKVVHALRAQLHRLDDPGTGQALGAVLALALAIWSGSAAFRTVITALNEALDLEERRSGVQRVLVSIALAALTATLALAATLLVALGPAIGAVIRDAPGGAHGWFAAWRIVRWPIVVACVFSWLAVTYSYAPADRQRLRIVTPGILTAFVLWAAFALLFTKYIDSVAQQGQLYGAFAGLVAFQLYVYWSAIIVLLGAEVDSALARRGGRSTSGGAGR